MRKLKADFLLAAVLLLAGGMAVATSAPARPNRDNSWKNRVPVRIL